ncbi:MAG: hypothetical protein LBJ72_11930 [Dysgonamonadaceae bacterium]|nr:hypothetical protein [Dysgonamonadaceae bacterium]
MKENIKKWLSDRKRQYADGLALFLQFASSEMKKRYAGYFREVTEQPAQFDQHFTMLINKLSIIVVNFDLIHRNNPDNPVLDNSAPTETTRVLGVTGRTGNTDSEKQLLSDRQAKEKELEDLKTELESAQESGEEKEERIEELESEIEDKESEIEELQEKIETLRKGVKIVKEEDLPEELLAMYRRTQEITPLYAALKTEIADEKISDDERKAKAEELCKLDDERRSIWNKLDAWAAGEEVRLEVKGVDPDEDLSNDPFTRGLQLANAIKRTKENISRSKGSVTKFTKSGDLNKAAKAQARMDHYQAELEKLEKLSTS